jgi:serine/threonine-protein kinase
MIDTTIQHFRVIEHLGGGAMGLVYRAEDTRDGRLVALKFLPFELKEDPDARERFLREAQAASALDHPNICTVYEIGEADDGRMFAALGFYEGETLKKKLGRGPLPVDETLSIARQLALGLGEAHSHGIVHRDLVPANVLVTENGQVRILDFGLAKMVSGGGLTQIGWSLGTPEYMSPEQIRGDDSDQTGDLWSLGALFYEMLTGNQPFAGANLAGVLLEIQNKEPDPPSTVREGVPASLDPIVAKLLAKDPSQRYSSCDELLDDLGRDDDSTPQEPKNPARPAGTAPTEALGTRGSGTAGQSGLPWAWILAVLVILAVLAFVLL